MLKNNGFRSTKTSKINMSSMADVAFLVIIFFWVATSIPAQKGVSTTLPKIRPGCVWENRIYCGPRYVIQVLVNSRNQILLNDEEIALTEIKEKIKEYAINTKKELEG